jgi:hypothetical protein
MNTYQLSEHLDVLIIESPSGDVSAEKIINLRKKLKAMQDSKQLNIQTFDAQIQEIQDQIAFVESITTIPPDGNETIEA